MRLKHTAIFPAGLPNLPGRLPVAGVPSRFVVIDNDPFQWNPRPKHFHCNSNKRTGLCNKGG